MNTLTNSYTVSVLICFKSCKFATFVFWNFQLKLQFLECSLSVISENNHALPESIVLMYSKVFLIRNSSFQENVKTKVFALEDSLGVESHSTDRSRRGSNARQLGTSRVVYPNKVISRRFLESTYVSIKAKSHPIPGMQHYFLNRSWDASTLVAWENGLSQVDVIFTFTDNYTTRIIVCKSKKQKQKTRQLVTVHFVTRCVCLHLICDVKINVACVKIPHWSRC